jgi:hypothetical protein
MNCLDFIAGEKSATDISAILHGLAIIITAVSAAIAAGSSLWNGKQLRDAWDSDSPERHDRTRRRVEAPKQPEHQPSKKKDAAPADSDWYTPPDFK